MPWAGRGGAPHGTHYHSAIWWKEQWRTFWPGAVVLAAAATQDGELATIALTMAERGTGFDRKFADWSVHGYKQLALRGVRPQPRRDNYVIADPDIGGLRMRYGQLSSVFTSNSFGYTLAGAMTPESGLAGAYPLVRLDPLARNLKYEYTNLHIAGWRKPEAMFDIQKDAAAAAGAYAPHEQRTTWRTPHVSGPWRVQQVWLYRPDRIIGAMVLRATGDTKARSAEHIYRMMTDRITPAGKASYDAGDLRVTIGPTNLPHVLVEPARKFAMNKQEPWRQLVLSDRKRPTKPEARKRTGNDDELLPVRDYEAGRTYYSLVEIRRTDALAARPRLLSKDEGLLAFSAEIAGQAFLAAGNFAGEDGPRQIEWRSKEWSIPAGAVKLIRHQ